MRIFGWFVVVLTGVFLFLTKFVLGWKWDILIAVYGGLFSYWAFKESWDERKSAMMNVLKSGLVVGVVLSIQNLFLILKSNSASETLDFVSQVSSMSSPDWLGTFVVVLLFIAVPALAMYLDGLVSPYHRGFKRSPWLVVYYLFLTFGIYQFHWFVVLKRDLAKEGIETVSLWWFALPLVGGIVVFVSFSQALEKLTNRNFLIWFLVFFFLQGIAIVISQSLINSDLAQEVDQIDRSNDLPQMWQYRS